MSIEEIKARFSAAVIDSDRGSIDSILEEFSEQGMRVEEIVFSVIVPFLDSLTEKLKSGDITLAQHFVASQILGDTVEKFLDSFEKRPESRKTIVLGTAFGDFHGLGKKIVGGYLMANTFRVVDAGLNVSAERFVQLALEEDAHIIGISSMMVHTATSEEGPAKIRRILKERGLESSIKLIVGGAPYRYDEQLYARVGADDWGRSGIEAVEVVKRLLEEVS